MTAFNNGAGLYLNSFLCKTFYAYENGILTCNHGRTFSAESK